MSSLITVTEEVGWMCGDHRFFVRQRFLRYVTLCVCVWGGGSLTVTSLPLPRHYKDITVATLPLLSGNKVLPSTITLTTLTVVKEKAVRKQAHHQHKKDTQKMH